MHAQDADEHRATRDKLDTELNRSLERVIGVEQKLELQITLQQELTEAREVCDEPVSHLTSLPGQDRHSSYDNSSRCRLSSGKQLTVRSLRDASPTASEATNRPLLSWNVSATPSDGDCKKRRRASGRERPGRKNC
jgi:hypothetical protein